MLEAWDCGEFGHGLAYHSASEKYLFPPSEHEAIQQIFTFQGKVHLLAGDTGFIKGGSLYRLETDQFPPRLERLSLIPGLPIQAVAFREEILLILTREDLLAYWAEPNFIPRLSTWVNQGPWAGLGNKSLAIAPDDPAYRDRYSQGTRIVVGTDTGLVLVQGRIPYLRTKLYLPPR